MKDVQKVVDSLDRGEVVVLPTDTIYGICASAKNKTAVKALYDLKDRHNKPGTVIAASIEQLVGLGIKRRYLTAVEQFWPGPVSVIVPVSSDLNYLSMAKPDLAVRIPADENLTDLLNKTGPLLTTSANHPGQPPANTVAQAREYFGKNIGVYVDGGDLSDHSASTIIRIIDDAIDIVRQGAYELPRF